MVCVDGMFSSFLMAFTYNMSSFELMPNVCRRPCAKVYRPEEAEALK